MVNLSYTAHGTGNHYNIGLNGLSNGNFLQLTGTGHNSRNRCA